MFVTGENHTVAGDVRTISDAAPATTEHRLLTVAGSGYHGVALLKPDDERQAPAVRAAVEGFIAAHTSR